MRYFRNPGCPDFKNPYADEIAAQIAAHKKQPLWKRALGLTSRMEEKEVLDMLLWQLRRELVAKYSFSVPSEEAIAKIAALSPLISIGAGTGYWERLIANCGGDILAFDYSPPRRGENVYGHRNEWFPVQKGGPKTQLEYSGRSLFLSWPPFQNDMGERCIRLNQGPYLVYVGEGKYGATGTDRMHDYIREHYEQLDYVHLWQWYGIRDGVYIYQKK